MAALPLAAACGQSAAPAPTAAPKTEAKPTTAPAGQPAATAAPAAKAGEAPKPAAQAPAVAKAKISGRLAVVQFRDFHPDHNAFVEKTIKEWADQQGYPIDHSYVEGFVGAGNIIQKLTASVQAGDAPDVLNHTLSPSELKFLEITEDVDSLQKDISKELGKTVPGHERRALLDGKYWSVGAFTRSGSYWAREGPFKAAGIDIRTDLDTWDKVRDACLKASKPEQELWGWGMTGNRSGDGDTRIRDSVITWGGQLVDETGQIVVLNTEPYRSYAIAGLEWLKETYTDPKWAPMLPPGVNAWTDPSNNEAYLAGKIFFTGNAGTMFAKAIFDKNPVADDTYLVQRPKGAGPGARAVEGADPAHWFILKNSKNREAAEQLIKHMTSPAIQRELFKISTGYVYPAYEWGWDDPIITENQFAQHVTPAFQKAAFDPAGYIATPWPGPPTPQAGALDTSNWWTDMFGEILGGKSVPDAVRDAHNRAVRVFKEFGAKGE